MTFSTRKLGLVLAISLGLNLFLAGFLVASAWHSSGPPQARMDSPERGPMLFHAGEAFGDPKHPALAKMMRKHRASLREHRRQIRSARQRVKVSMTAEPFDPRALDRALAGLRQETSKSQARVHRALIEIATDMTPEQRQQLAKLSGRHQRGRRGPGRIER